MRAVGFPGYAIQTAVGALVVGALLALVGGLLTRQLVVEKPRQAKLDEAVGRTLERYRDAPRADRFYVSAKLRSDPVVEVVLSLEGSFGQVVDAAAGRGQLGLLLLDMQRATRVVGFDIDSRKIGIAARAAGADAEFSTADLRSADWPPADTVLLMDVLHYLGEPEQQAVLEQAAKSLEVGGRLLVREVDPTRGLRARLTMLAERIGADSGYNRGSSLVFREPKTMVKELTALGLVTRTLPASTGTPLSNVLILAERPRSADAARAA